jgi:hypothetical protein
MRGPANLRNYVGSGKFQPGLSNHFSPLSAGEEFAVPKSELHFPSGMEWWKGLIGQRKWIPTELK